MKIKASLAPIGSGTEREHTTVLTADGQALDVDTVLTEIIKDGDEVHIEYSGGPQAYRTRWEGRPPTPPFQWGESGQILPPHDQWLRDLDMASWGLDKLVEPALLLKDANFLQQDLQATKDLLLQWSGALQAVFLVYQLQGDVSIEVIGRMNLTQFRLVIATAKIITPSYSNERVDDTFNTLAAACRVSKATLTDTNNPATITFTAFLAGLVHIAHGKAAAAIGSGPNTAQFTQLSSKVEMLIRSQLVANVLPDISKKVERFQPAWTPGAQMLLQKGRRLTEQTLIACQFKRVRAESVHVEMRHLCVHLARWRLLNKEFNLPDLSYMTLFAKQQASHAEDFQLLPHPIWLDCDDFERLIVAMSLWLYQQRKRKEPIEEFLGAMMDFIYKKAGLLQEAAPGTEAANTGAFLHQ